MQPLRAALEAHRPQLAAAAQQILDAWEVDEDGYDEEFGTGGACDAISHAFSEHLGFLYVDAAGRTRHPNIVDGGQDGDDHAWLVVFDEHEIYAVDLPAGVYEVGGGYNWTKRAGVRIRPSDIVIDPLVRSDFVFDESLGRRR